MINIKTFYFNPFEECTVLMWDESGAGVIVDPGCYDKLEIQALTDYMAGKGIKPVAIWLTHSHPDHIYGVAPLLKQYSIPVYMHPLEDLGEARDMAARFCLMVPDTDFVTTPVKDGDVLGFGSVEFSVIETPGHTVGGVCFYDEADKVLITGDTLFAGSIGRTDLDGGDYDVLIVSIMDKLMGLPGDTDIIPGHGSPSDIGWERTHNPFLQPFNEPEDSFPDEPVS